MAEISCTIPNGLPFATVSTSISPSEYEVVQARPKKIADYSGYDGARKRFWDFSRNKE